MASGEELDEIRAVARAFEYDRYLTALLMPRETREPLILLAAFSGELRRIPTLVSEPMIGAIRLQWWRDALEAAAGAAPGAALTGNPLADALADVAHRHALPWGLLQGIIDAAESELDPTTFERTAETRQHLVKSDAALFELAGRVAGARASREVWANAGIAYGAFRHALAYERARSRGGQTFVAREVVDPVGDEAGHGARWFRDCAAAALQAFEPARPTLDRPARRVLLPLAIVGPFLRRSSSAADGTAASAEPTPLARATRLLWTHWRGGF